MRWRWRLALVVALAITTVAGPYLLGVLLPRGRAAERGWEIARSSSSMGGFESVSFVVVAKDRAKDATIYSGAVKELCDGVGSAPLCVIYFFLPGDPMPARAQWPGSEKSDPIVVWLRDEFTTWDCDRGPTVGAPASALCGPGVWEAFDALLAEASRQRIGAFCGWAPRADMDAHLSILLQYAAKQGRSELFQHALAEAADTRREIAPDYDCGGMQTKVDALVENGMRHFLHATGRGQHGGDLAR